MKNAIKKYDYNGSKMEFEVIEGEVYANATAMCEAFGKKVNNWLRNKRTISYIAALEKRYANSRYGLVRSQQGGTQQGTWIHEKLVLDLTRWLNPDFAVWCDEKIAELLSKGYVTIDPKARRIEQLRKAGKDESFIQLRLQAVDGRNGFTSALKNHGVEREGYGMCTRAIYAGVFGGDGSSSFVRQKLGIGKKTAIRDSINRLQLAMVTLAEEAAADRIKQDQLTGNVECTQACKTASQAISKAVLVSQKQLLAA